MLIGEKLLRLSLLDHPGEELLGDIVLDQPRAVLGEGGVIE